MGVQCVVFTSKMLYLHFLQSTQQKMSTSFPGELTYHGLGFCSLFSKERANYALDPLPILPIIEGDQIHLNLWWHSISCVKLDSMEEVLLQCLWREREHAFCYPTPHVLGCVVVQRP